MVAPPSAAPGWEDRQRQDQNEKAYPGRAARDWVITKKLIHCERFVLFKHRLMLSVAATALLAAPAYATKTISTSTTTALKTSTAGGTATPDNIVIDANGVIAVTSTTPAITIDSANTLINNGKITNLGTDSARGIVIDASGAPAATGYLLPAGTTAILTQNGTIDLTGKGNGKIGVVFTGGKFTGDLTMTASSIMNVKGDNSMGIQVASTAELVGDINALGIIQVEQADVTATTGSTITAINILGKVKSINIGGQLTAAGQGAAALVVGSTATVSGTISNTGTIFATGAITPNTKVVNPEGGSAVVITASVAKGFINSGATSATGTETAASILMAGTGPAVVISANTADITIGQIDSAIDASNPFSFINHGSIGASPVDPNTIAPIIGVQIGGSAAFKTFLTSGFQNTGTISATATSVTGGAKVASSNNVVGVEIGRNAEISLLSNQAFSAVAGSVDAGIIRGEISGVSGGSAVGLLIDAGANPAIVAPSPFNGTMQIDNLDGAQISASASTTDTGITALNATAILDSSGSVTKIRNTGQISAIATALDGGQQVAIAIDARANALGIEIDNGFGGKTGIIVGDVITGSGADSINLLGVAAGQRSSLFGELNFGSSGGGTNDELNIGQFSDVSSALVSSDGNLDVHLSANSTLNVNNAALATPAPTLLHDLTVDPTGQFSITIAQGLNSGVIQSANGHINLAAGSKFNVNFGSFISNTGNFVLLDAAAGNLNIPDANLYAQDFTTPFLFTGGLCLNNVAAAQGGTPALTCAAGTTASTHSQLILSLQQKTAAALHLTGYAKELYTIVNLALPNDNTLGAAIVRGVTSDADAQAVYDAFAPTVNGGSRALAVALTDQATGAIGARQRILRTYGKQAGESTLWGVEYAQFIKDPGDTSVGGKSGYKDHGFGFSLGADGGSASSGWYGGALTFYTGDIGEIGDRSGQAQTEWYMLSGYTDWRGRGLFLDTNLSVGVVQFKGKRNLNIDLGTTTFSRTALNKHIGVYLAGGFTTGAILKYAGTTITPQLSVDGLTMRENGYTESGGGPVGGDGFDLAVGASYSNSLRAFLGTDLRQDIDLGSFFLQPEARIGYRYDFVGSPQKVSANFVSVPGTTFTVQGPDPSQGNIVAGGSISASTDTWSIGISYDWVRGTNGAVQQSGALTLVGRI